MIRIRLEDIHIKFADDLAIRRQNAAVSLNRRAHNNAPDGYESALDMHRLGTRAEAAGKIFLNPITWNAFSWKIRDLPDLDTWIDVKGRKEPWHDLIVQNDDPPEWAYLLILAHEHPIYNIIGWTYGKDAQHNKYLRDPAGGRPAYFVKQHLLRKPEELSAIVRGAPPEGRTPIFSVHYGSARS